MVDTGCFGGPQKAHDPPEKWKLFGDLTHLLQSLQRLGLDEPSKSGDQNFNSPGADTATVSSADLTVLRGVAEKGQYFDPRNLVLRVMTGAGTITAGLLGITKFGPSFAPGVAAFNGPLLMAYHTIFPDLTVNQLNRLNDSAFLANTIVGKQQARVIVVFIPMEFLLTAAQVKQFFRAPESILGCPDLRLLDASVNGNFVTTVLPAAVITSIVIQPNEEAKFGTDNFTVAGVVNGRFLERAKVALSGPPAGVTVTADGNPTDSQLRFVVKGKTPLMPGQALDFQVGIDGTEAAKSTVKVAYQPARPTLQAGALDPATLAPGATKAVTVKGSNFLPEGMQVLLEPSADVKIGPVQYISNSELKVELTVAGSAAQGQRQFRLSSAGGVSDPASTLTIKK